MADQIPLGSPEHVLSLNRLRALAANDNSPTLTPWERDWIRSQKIRLGDWGDDTYISEPEAEILRQLVVKLSVFVPPVLANDN